MSSFIDKHKGRPLPPMPGEEKKSENKQGLPFAIYINGKLEEVSKTEALHVLAQITDILIYQNEFENSISTKG